MTKTKRGSLILILSIICSIALGQKRKLDSLWVVYKNQSNADTARLKAIDAIAWEYKNFNPDSAIVLAEEEKQLATKRKKRIYESKAYNTIGAAFDSKGNLAKALENYFAALGIAEEIGDKKMIGNYYGNIGNIYKTQSNYPKALEHYLKTLKIFEEIGNKRGVAMIYVQIGSIYKIQSDNSKAISYYLKSLKMGEELGNKKIISVCYTKIGEVNKAQNNYTDALENYLKALKINEEIGDKTGKGNAFNDIGEIYIKQSDYKNALQSLLKALEILKAVKNKRGVGISYGNISNAYSGLGNFKDALLYSDSSLIIFKELGDIHSQGFVYEILAKANNKLGNYKEAYENHIKFKTLTDSLFNSDNSKKLGDLKTQFEVEKREAELKAEQDKKDLIFQAEVKRKQLEYEYEQEQEKLKTKQKLDELSYNENLKRLKLNEDFEKKKAAAKAVQDRIDLENKSRSRQQRIITFSVAAGLILVLVFSLFLLKRFRITQRQKGIIEKQKIMVDKSYEELHEKNKEVMDSIRYAKRIQNALITSEKYIANQLNRLMKN